MQMHFACFFLSNPLGFYFFLIPLHRIAASIPKPLSGGDQLQALGLLTHCGYQ